MTLPNVQGLLRHDTVKTLRHVDFNTEDRGPIVERVDYVVVQSTMCVLCGLAPEATAQFGRQPGLEPRMKLVHHCGNADSPGHTGNGDGAKAPCLPLWDKNTPDLKPSVRQSRGVVDDLPK